MTILYVFRSLAVWGGIERILVEKMNHLVRMYGYEVYMLTTDQGLHPVPYALDDRVHLEDLGIRFHQQYQYRGVRKLLVARRLRRLFEEKLSMRIAQIRPDVVVCTTANYVDLDCIVRLKGDIPLLVESHSNYRNTFGRPGLFNRYADYRYDMSLRKARMIVALTAGDAADWRRHYSQVAVIPDMVHVSDGKCSDLTGKRVIFVGRFDYQKRPMEVIRIWQMVHPQFPDWQLDIYGEGEGRRELEEAACSLGMNIHIYPPTKDIFEAYCRSSVLVSTSLFEPFGMVIPEAMSCGLPVVAYDCPFGPSGIISDGKDGYLVEVDDREAFARRLALLMGDATLRLQMGSMAMTVTGRFSAGRIMPLWKKAFEDVVAQSE